MSEHPKDKSPLEIGGAFVAGVIFAVGLAVGGMTQPSKVVGFLDFFGAWDPSLILVMGGAVAVHAVAIRLIGKRKNPLFAATFHVPTRRDLTLPLVLGSALFGIGWGLGGFCPGPGLASLPTGGPEALAFVGSMALGMLLYEGVRRWREPPPAEEVKRDLTERSEPS